MNGLTIIIKHHRPEFYKVKHLEFLKLVLGGKIGITESYHKAPHIYINGNYFLNSFEIIHELGNEITEIPLSWQK
jgi:hypothetical protein